MDPGAGHDGRALVPLGRSAHGWPGPDRRRRPDTGRDPPHRRQHRQLPGITAASGRVYPWIQSSPDTRVLYSGPDNSIRRFSWWGTGAQETALARDGIGRSYGSYATYGPGLTIVSGGGSQSVGGINMPYASASIIDTRSGGLQVTPQPRCSTDGASTT